MRILLVEDDKDLGVCIHEELAKKYVVDFVQTATEAIYAATITPYDLYIVDVVLGDSHGVAVCRKLRALGKKEPVLMLTAKKHPAVKVVALDAGADDYLTKPFSYDELFARIRALLRRSSMPLQQDLIKIGPFHVNFTKRSVKRGTKEILLRRKEFDLLEYFIRHPKEILSRGDILEHVWEQGLESFSNTVDVHVKYLRDKLEPLCKKKLFMTIPGVGYKFIGL